ncbi:hypothetical protein LC612_07580 [Nostoc sp. CHAB 5834]|nr:hypothetical protein [Nostoc sp. CHAB 5834]
MSKGGRKSTTWQPGWNGGKTTLIRVPIILKNDVLAYARAVDSKLKTDKSRNIPMLKGDFLQEFTLGLIESYIEFKRHNYHPNQNSRVLDTNTRAWDELRKFQKLLRESPEKLN